LIPDTTGSPGSTTRLKRIAQYQQALRELAALDQQLPFRNWPAVCQNARSNVWPPRLTRNFSIGGCEIAYHRRDAADAVIQDATKQSR